MTPTDDWLTAFLAAERLPASYARTIEAVAVPLAGLGGFALARMLPRRLNGKDEGTAGGCRSRA